VHVPEGVTVESNPEVSMPSEEVETEAREVSEEPTHPDNQDKPQMH
jgi:hypothetical protein